MDTIDKRSSNTKAIERYAPFKDTEIIRKLSSFGEDERLIVRVDGKRMTRRFKETGKLYVEDFYQAMCRVVENIVRECPFIKVAYSYNDEISFLIDTDLLFSKYKKLTKLEKLLPILSGYTSSLFTIYLDDRLKKYKGEPFSFDARAVIMRKCRLKKYFAARQYFGMSGLVDKWRVYTGMDNVNMHNEEDMLASMQERDFDFDSIPKYVYNGIVGEWVDGKWQVHEIDIIE